MLWPDLNPGNTKNITLFKKNRNSVVCMGLRSGMHGKSGGYKIETCFTKIVFFIDERDFCICYPTI